MQIQEAIGALEALIEPGRAEGMAKYHKQSRPVLGIANPALNDLTKTWRQTLSVEQRVALASDLWQTNIFEARLAASKVLTQARLRPDDEAWLLIANWVPDFDSWAIADHACMAGQKRLVATPSRLDLVETWTTSEHMWTRRAALVITLPWTKQNFPKPAELEARDRILGWAAGYVKDHTWFIQKAIGWWLRDLSKHDPERVTAFLERHSSEMKPFAVKEAARNMR